MGRFFQEDTYLGDITDPLTLNRYAYVKNSPLNYSDPSGNVADYTQGTGGLNPGSGGGSYPAVSTKPNGNSPGMGVNDGAILGELAGGLLIGAAVMFGAPVRLPVALFAIASGAATGMLAGGTAQKNHQTSLKKSEIAEIERLIKANESTLRDISNGQEISETAYEKLQSDIENLNTKLNLAQCDLDRYQAEIEGYQSLALITVIAAGGASITLQELMAMNAQQTGSLIQVTQGKFDISQLTRSQQKAIESAVNIINDHLTPSDLSGALGDLQGNPIARPGGGYWNHAQEVKDAFAGLVRAGKTLKGSLQNPKLSPEAEMFIQDKYDMINDYIKIIEDLFAPYGGIK